MWMKIFKTLYDQKIRLILKKFTSLWQCQICFSIIPTAIWNLFHIILLFSALSMIKPTDLYYITINRITTDSPGNNLLLVVIINFK